MSDCSERASRLAYFLVGGGIGAIIGLLFAPRAGRETRDIIVQRATDSRERVATATRTTSDKMAGYVEKGRKAVSEQRDQLSAAIQAGKQIYQVEKDKTEPEAE